MKRCPRCQIVKSRDEFGTSSSSADGCSSYCKECQKEYRKEYAQQNPERVRQYRRQSDQNRSPEAKRERERKKYLSLKANPEKAREKYRRRYIRKMLRNNPDYVPRDKLTPEERLNRRAESKKRSNEKHRDKRNARNKLWRAINSGKLIPGPCAICGCTENIHGHHANYAKPLDVIWLCRKHHDEEHARLRKESALIC